MERVSESDVTSPLERVRADRRTARGGRDGSMVSAAGLGQKSEGSNGQFADQVQAAVSARPAAGPAIDWLGIVRDSAAVSPQARTAIVAIWVPLRHLAWAASLSAATLAASSSNRRFAKRNAELSTRQLEVSRFFSTLGWALDRDVALRSARRVWLEDPAWQSLRRYAEDALALRDPGESSLAWTLILDGVLWQLLDARALRHSVGDEARALSPYFDALFEWLASGAVWANPDIEGNPSPSMPSLRGHWGARAASAALPVAVRVWKTDADETLGAAMERLADWTSGGA